MRKLMLICLFAITALTASAQKFALLDMEYILKNIPAYERANEQLNQVSKKWQAEVEALNTEASTMYKNYQNEMVFLSAEQKKERQETIMKKEKGSQRPEAQVFRSGRRALQEARESDVAHPGGNLHCRKGNLRASWLLLSTRPSLRRWHHLRFAEDRHQQRGAAEVRI